MWKRKQKNVVSETDKMNEKITQVLAPFTDVKQFVSSRNWSLTSENLPLNYYQYFNLMWNYHNDEWKIRNFTWEIASVFYNKVLPYSNCGLVFNNKMKRLNLTLNKTPEQINLPNLDEVYQKIFNYD